MIVERFAKQSAGEVHRRKADGAGCVSVVGREALGQVSVVVSRIHGYLALRSVNVNDGASGGLVNTRQSAGEVYTGDFG